MQDLIGRITQLTTDMESDLIKAEKRIKEHEDTITRLSKYNSDLEQKLSDAVSREVAAVKALEEFKEQVKQFLS